MVGLGSFFKNFFDIPNTFWYFLVFIVHFGTFLVQTEPGKLWDGREGPD